MSCVTNCRTANRLGVYILYLPDTRLCGAMDLADTKHTPLASEQTIVCENQRAVAEFVYSAKTETEHI